MRLLPVAVPPTHHEQLLFPARLTTAPPPCPCPCRGQCRRMRGAWGGLCATRWGMEAGVSEALEDAASVSSKGNYPGNTVPSTSHVCSCVRQLAGATEGGSCAHSLQDTGPSPTRLAQLPASTARWCVGCTGSPSPQAHSCENVAPTGHRHHRPHQRDQEARAHRGAHFPDGQDKATGRACGPCLHGRVPWVGPLVGRVCLWGCKLGLHGAVRGRAH